ncbi:MAG TPA: hypothetical protein VIL07_12060 [Symbiobacteriaceae bacterium]
MMAPDAHRDAALLGPGMMLRRLFAMFMCKQCLQQYEDDHLAYTLLPEYRLRTSPPESMDMFTLKFCSLEHTREYLKRISPQKSRYILTKKSKDGDKQFEPNIPAELLILIGSSEG